jgi:hypothetical protein
MVMVMALAWKVIHESSSPRVSVCGPIPRFAHETVLSTVCTVKLCDFRAFYCLTSPSLGVPKRSNRFDSLVDMTK